MELIAQTESVMQKATILFAMSDVKDDGDALKDDELLIRFRVDTQDSALSRISTLEDNQMKVNTVM